MTKKEFKVLEKVFASQIECSVYQGKCKSVKKLEEDGYVVMIEKILGKDRFGLIKVKGYITTLKGNVEYCMSCGDPDTKLEEMSNEKTSDN